MQSSIQTVKENIEIANSIYKMTVSSPGKAHCGQFYMLRRPDSAVLLPRPLSLCDQTDDSLVFLYQTVGRGTQEFSALRAGEPLRVTGPLGNGFDIDSLPFGRIALVGGGIGIAPMLLTARMLRARGISTDCFCGFRDQPYLTQELAEHVENLHIATESGKVGKKGFVTQILNPSQYAAILCCGPTPMMKAMQALCETTNTPLYVSLETRMACGMGGCLVCTCTDKEGHNRRTCKDGPVFLASEVDFDA